MKGEIKSCWCSRLNPGVGNTSAKRYLSCHSCYTSQADFVGLLLKAMLHSCMFRVTNYSAAMHKCACYHVRLLNKGCVTVDFDVDLPPILYLILFPLTACKMLIQIMPSSEKKKKWKWDKRPKKKKKEKL